MYIMYARGGYTFIDRLKWLLKENETATIQFVGFEYTRVSVSWQFFFFTRYLSTYALRAFTLSL